MLIMCNEGRIAVYPWEKAQLGRSVNSEAAYYTSLEIKEENNIRQAKLDKYILQRCRATGTIYGPDRIYNVYNTERGLIEIHEDDEEVYCGLVQELGKETFYQGIHQLVDGIILTHDYDQIEEISHRHTKYRNNKLTVIPFLTAESELYEKLYLIPASIQGIALFTIMTEKDWEDRLDEMILKESKCKVSELDCDGMKIGKSGTITYITNFLKPDVKKLVKMKYHCESEQQGNYDIHIFPFQEDGVRKMFNHLDVNIIIHDMNEVYNEYFGL